MSITGLILLAIGLSMDAFAVSICKGLALKRIALPAMLLVGCYFGLFQAGMPLLGYLLGHSFYQSIQTIDHWVTVILLSAIGANMIWQSRNPDIETHDSSLGLRSMLILAIATSIDALAVGVTFAFLEVNIWLACAAIGSITFALSTVGVKIGHVFGAKYKSRAELAGGIILIGLGAKILIEHLHEISI